jgi:CBS domain-containing protein
MKASELMTPCPDVVTPDDSITCAAEVMHYTDDAFVPVVRDRENPVLVGVITARDVVVRCVARHHPLTCRVRDHMTPMPLHTLFPSDDIRDVARLMCDRDVRRIPVVTADGVLSGVVHEPDLRRAIDRLDVPVGSAFTHRASEFPSWSPT